MAVTCTRCPATGSQQSLVVTDTTTGATVHSIPLSGSGTQPVTAADGTTVYVPSDSGSVQVVNTQTGQVDAINVGGTLRGATLSEDGKHLYVAQETGVPLPSGGSFPQGHIIDINTDTGQYTTYDTQAYVPYAVSPTTDGRDVYAVGQDYTDGSSHQTIVVVDTTQNDSQRLEVLGSPTSVNVSPDGEHVYVTVDSQYPEPGHPHGQLVVLDSSDNSIVKQIDIGETAAAAAFSPDGSRDLCHRW